MQKVLIVEDESLTAQKLEKMLLEIDRSIEIVGKLQSVKQSVEWLFINKKPDVIFMDIQLGDGLCFEIFMEYSGEVPIVFVTAFDEYALQAFDLNCIDYLLKPVDRKRLVKCLEKIKRYSGTGINTELDEVFKKLYAHQPIYRERFLINYRDLLIPMAVKEVAYFTSEFKTTFIVTKANKKYQIEQTMEELDRELDTELFFRVTRQLIVSSNAIKSLNISLNGRLTLLVQPGDEEEVVISRDKAISFRKWLAK